MKFDELESRMRVFETAHDHAVLPGIHMVARLDGRGFTRLTKELHDFERPFDVRFRDYMLATTEHLVGCGFAVIYAYTQSDEISLLFRRDENSFGRKARKLMSVLAGEASARFSLLLGDVACFDARISELPTADDVRDYFRWRFEDAHRNALSAHCYWLLRNQGKSARAADKALLGMSGRDKNELLFQHGINFNDLPAWQKRGTGIYWEAYEKSATNPRTGEAVLATRRRLKRDSELPLGDGYDRLVLGILRRAESET